jgi:glycine betaine/proline transport system permease protein
MTSQAADGGIVPRIPLDDWATAFVTWLTATFGDYFDTLTAILASIIDLVGAVLLAPHPFVSIALLALIGYATGGWRVALLTAVGLLLIISLELWGLAMLTLALVISSGFISLLIGIPVGVLAAQFRGVHAVVEPILDVMQTMPSFVYLIPMVLLLGLGNVPALIATLIFAMPPAIRLTLLGLRQVPETNVEAAHAFGATRWQTLTKVELPLAMPSVMAGVNQVIMLSLSMVVVAALIGAGGLGAEVIRGLSSLDVGRGFVGGVGIVVLALVLDRITRNAGQPRVPGGRRPSGFIALLRSRASTVEN